MPLYRLFGHWAAGFVLISVVSAAATAAPRNETLFSFAGGDGSIDGYYATLGLVADRSGVLYGVTPRGGSKDCGGGNCGTIFRLVPPSTAGRPWTHQVLYAFEGGADGAIPETTPVIDGAGNLYGTTTFGGAAPYAPGYYRGGGGGVVWELAPPSNSGGDWTYSVLHTFHALPSYYSTSFPIDGVAPTALTISQDGTLYGTTRLGGDGLSHVDLNKGGLGYGTIFSLTPPAGDSGAWGYSILYDFQGADGAFPREVQVGGGSGQLVGHATDVRSGCDFCATIFLLHRDVLGVWEYTLAARLPADGPIGSLLLDGDHNLYYSGIGGLNYNGTIDELVADFTSLSQTFTQNVFYLFSPPGGFFPTGGLTRNGSGSLFGATYESGGAAAADGSTGTFGTTYEIDPPGTAGGSWQLTPLHAFSGFAGDAGQRPDGAYPTGPLIFGYHHALYGLTAFGGRFGKGTVFQQYLP